MYTTLRRKSSYSTSEQTKPDTITADYKATNVTYKCLLPNHCTINLFTLHVSAIRRSHHQGVTFHKHIVRRSRKNCAVVGNKTLHA
jgi:hypothetical protein